MAQLGQEIEIRDITITLDKASRECIYSDAGRRWVCDQDEGVILRFTLRNYNPDRFVSARAQMGATLVDDLGNVYAHFKLMDGSRRVPVFMFQGASPDYVQAIEPGFWNFRSDEIRREMVVFERPVPGARKLTFRLDSGCYGGRGDIVFQCDYPFSKETPKSPPSQPAGKSRQQAAQASQ
jgi:hypothetical protein